jgi:cysteine-rich repeat protein
MYCDWTIGTGGNGVALRFVNFFTEANYDQVAVWSCATTACIGATQVASLSGDVSASGIINITSGIARVRFTADGCISGPGFSVFWAPMTHVGSSTCGNSLREGLEMCDDGNIAAGDGCAADCSEVEVGYQCTTDGAPCTAACGDGVKARAEECDDGNSADGDGCSKDCECESAPCSYGVSGRGHLHSVLATASDGTTVRLLDTTYGGPVSHALKVSSSNITLTFASTTAQTRAVLGGPYGCAIRLSGQARRFRVQNIDLSPGFRFYLQSGTSLEVTDTAADHIGIFAENASVIIASAKFTRRLDSTASIHIVASKSAVSLQDTVLIDKHDNQRLIMTGSDNVLTIRKSALSSLVQSGPCILVAGDNMQLDLVQSNITWCWANYGPGGGGINFIGKSGRMTLNNSLLTDNGADGSTAAGGGCLLFQSPSGSLVVDSCNFASNMVLRGNGGAIHCAAVGTSMQFSRSSIAFSLNINGAGSGMFFNGTRLLLEDSSIISNRASRGLGGGVYAITLDPLSIRNVTISKNFAVSGAGLSTVSDSVSVTNCTLQGNTAVNFGGGISFRGLTGALCSLAMDGCLVDGNVASSRTGGGLHSIGCNVIINTSRVRANSAGINGGGIYLEGSGDDQLTIARSNITSNIAKASGGGTHLLHANLIAAGAIWSLNSALNGGGLSMAGAAKSGWQIQGGELASNSAQQGGGIYLSNSWHVVEKLRSGGGAPYAISPDGRTVYSRGSGFLGDLAACAWSTSNPACASLAVDGKDGLIVATSLDETLAAVLVSSGAADTSRGRIVAVRLPSGAPVDSMDVVKVSTKAQNFVASIAVANQNDDMVYSLGLSQAVSGRYMAVSTFYSTLVLDLSAPKLRRLNGTCAAGQYSASYYSGVNALAMAPDGYTLYLSRYENDLTSLRVWAVDLTSASSACTKPWASVEPAFRQTRSLGVSRDGLFLFVAEKVIIAGSDDDLHQIKMLSFSSGDTATVMTRGADGAASPFLFKSVVAMQMSGGDAGLTVLGMGDDQTPSWQKWNKGPEYDWAVWGVRTGGLRLEGVSLASNAAARDGGALCLEQLSLSRELVLDGVAARGNTAATVGGAVSISNVSSEVRVALPSPLPPLSLGRSLQTCLANSFGDNLPLSLTLFSPLPTPLSLARSI